MFPQVSLLLVDAELKLLMVLGQEGVPGKHSWLEGHIPAVLFHSQRTVRALYTTSKS